MGCTRKEIEFGTVPENNYTYLVYIDTVSIRLSTILTDSFATGSTTSFLVGKYTDPYLGIIRTKSFFQVDKPANISLPTGAIYDSISLIMRLNDFYYGDTTQLQTIAVNELAQAITLGYADKLYNTSNVEVKPAPLGSVTKSIRPSDDSIRIRLDDTKGMELFTKLQQQSSDVSTTDAFLNYFKGLSLSTTTGDNAAVFGLDGAAGKVVIRVHYHTNIPFEQLYYVDFPSLANEYAFYQLITDRSGTGIVPGITGITEIPSAQTNNYSFSQSGTGLDLKLTFPSLKNILHAGKYVKLLKADLFVRPAFQSFDLNKYKLPSSLSLASTDASNLHNGSVLDSTGQGIISATPVIDQVLGQNNYYRFNITTYINQLLGTAGAGNEGLLIVNNSSAASQLSRLVLSTVGHSNFTTQLQLSILIINQ
jgi:hypothetical protein